MDFTPGPWFVSESEYGCVITKDGMVVAEVDGMTDDDLDANARLIALAPKMLETLRAISALSYGYCDEGPSLALEIVREFEEGERWTSTASWPYT